MGMRGRFVRRLQMRIIPLDLSKGGSLSLSRLCFPSTDNSLSPAARLCLRARFYESHNYQWPKRPRVRGWLEATTPQWSRPRFSAVSGACGLDSPTQFRTVLRQLRFMFCVVPFAVCGTVVITRSRETLSVCVYTSAAYTQQRARCMRRGLWSARRRRQSKVGSVWERVVSLNMPRKKPFSNKQKKKQLQVKRERKRGECPASVSR